MLGLQVLDLVSDDLRELEVPLLVDDFLDVGHALLARKDDRLLVLGVGPAFMGLLLFLLFVFVAFLLVVLLQSHVFGGRNVDNLLQ